LFPAVATAVLVFGLFAERSGLSAVLDAVRYIVPSQVIDLANEQLTSLIEQPPTVVLRILKDTDIVTSDTRLAAYIERCTARPAFQRAFDAQLGDFKDAA
jgi:hypothetical protein